MNKFLFFLTLLPLSGVWAQKPGLDFRMSANAAFPGINDEAYEIPVILDANPVYTTYYVTPAHAHRRTAARPGVEAGLDLCWKPQNRWSFSTGLRAQWVRYRIETSYTLPEPNGVDTLTIQGTPLGGFYGNPGKTPPVVNNPNDQPADNGVDIGLIYAGLPLQVTFRAGSRLGFSVGLELAGLLAARQGHYAQIWDFRTGLYAEQYVTDSSKKAFSSLQMRALLGAQYRLSSKLKIAASFTGGLSSLYSKTETTGSTWNGKMRAVSLGLSYVLW